LDHKNVVKMLTHIQAKTDDEKDLELSGRIIVLEYLEGLDIIDFINSQGRLSEGVARFIFK